MLNTPASLTSGASAAAKAVARLPKHDARRWLDERAKRGWTESSRRVARGLVLLTSDLSAGVLGVFATLSSWEVVSAAGRRPLPDEVPLLAMVFFITPLSLHAFGAYKSGRARTDLSRIGAGVLLAALFGWAQARLFGREASDLPNKAAYLYAGSLITLFAYAGRIVLDKFIRLGFRSGRLQRRLVVIGPSTEAAALNVQCREGVDPDVKVVGNIEPAISYQWADAVRSDGNTVSPTLTAIEEMARETKAHGVLIVASVPLETLTAIMTHCFKLGLSVSLLPRVLNKIHGGSIDVRGSAAGPLIQIAPLRFDLPQLAIKRTMDLILTGLALVVATPLFLLISIAIKLDSRGPVLFSQTRAGLGGRPFRMFKFRTMRVGADEEKASLSHLNKHGDPRLFKIKNDPRVTRVGRLLRRSSLDELPQLLNILRGEMSLVGPRPFFPKDLAGYEMHHFERLHVLPGITGLWQVTGRSDVVDFEEVITLDRKYIENWTVLTDLVILAKTVPAAFRRGAY